MMNRVLPSASATSEEPKQISSAPLRSLVNNKPNPGNSAPQ
jgi:hypothetical protein